MKYEYWTQKKIFEVAKEAVESRGLTQAKLAWVLKEGHNRKVSQQAISKMLNGDPSMVQLAIDVIEALHPTNFHFDREPVYRSTIIFQEEHQEEQ